MPIILTYLMTNEKVSHRVPFGYKIKQTQVLSKDKNAKKVRKVFDTYLKREHIRKTARVVNLPISSVAYILRNKFYYNSKKPIISKSEFKRVQKILNSTDPTSRGTRYSNKLNRIVKKEEKKLTKKLRAKINAKKITVEEAVKIRNAEFDIRTSYENAEKQLNA